VKTCAVCDSPRSCGLLCEGCADQLAGVISLVPEQILSTVEPASRERRRDTQSQARSDESSADRSAAQSPAAFIDRWGRPHPVAPQMLVGRQPSAQGLAILSGSVSRAHAAVLHHPQFGWALEDKGSSNGTFVAGQRITESSTLRPGDTVQFGQVSFFFCLLDEVEDPFAPLQPAASETIRPEDSIVAPLAQAAAGGEDESTFSGLPDFPLDLIEPTGGGGGLLQSNRGEAQLSTIQFEFVSVLVDRMRAEQDQPELVRGFVRSSELIGTLSWDTAHPSEEHVKQLVRRTRRLLIAAEIGNLIESRRGFGYRLRVNPLARKGATR